MHLSDEIVTRWQFSYFVMNGIRILRQVNFITYMRVMSHNMTQKKYLNAMCGGEWKMWRDIQASIFSEIARNPNALRGRGIRSPTVHVQRFKAFALSMIRPWNKKLRIYIFKMILRFQTLQTKFFWIILFHRYLIGIEKLYVVDVIWIKKCLLSYLCRLKYE